MKYYIQTTLLEFEDNADIDIKEGKEVQTTLSRLEVNSPEEAKPFLSTIGRMVTGLQVISDLLKPR